MVKDSIVRYLAGITRDLEKQKDFSVYTAEQIASVMNLKRNTASGYLNQLVAQDVLVKTSSRPVCFFDHQVLEELLGVPLYSNTFCSVEELLSLKASCPREEDVFSAMAGAEGSLAAVVNQVKISIRYPPDGLPILIQGSTGVGKSHLAALAHRYAVAQGILKPDAPFLTFNCAQYFNNAELLSSSLFGYMKGSYTGAVSDRKGLLEEADGGILFMDEVHRLSPEGQEKLFTFMDKGIFRRMGETGGWRTARVRFIFASNLDVSSYMLQTFRRRIPILVKIPDLKERVQEEKLQMIYQHFIREAGKLEKEIRISRTVIQDMLSFSYEGNIGELINIIQYLCGNALVNSRDGKIRITRSCYPAYLLGQLSGGLQPPGQAGELSISPGEDIRNLIRRTSPDQVIAVSFFSQLVIAYRTVENGEGSWKGFEESWKHTLEQYLDQLFIRRQYLEAEKIRFYDQRTEDYYRQMNSNTGGKEPPHGLVSMVSLYLACNPDTLLEGIGEKPKLRRLLGQLRESYGEEYRLAEDFSRYLGRELERRASLEDSVFFTLYFRNVMLKMPDSPIRALVVCHGASAAHSMSNVCNNCLGKHIFQPVDLAPDTSFGQLVKKLRDSLEKGRQEGDVLVFADSGSMLEDIMPDRLAEALAMPGCSVSVVTHVNLPLLMAVGRRILENQPADRIISGEILGHGPRYSTVKPAAGRKRLIITTCISGEGTAGKIRHLLAEAFFDIPDLEIRSMDFQHLKNRKGIPEQYHLLAVVGTDNPFLPGIRFIPIDKLILGEEEGSLGSLFGDSLSGEHRQRINNRLVANFSLENMVGSLTIIDARILMQDIESFLERFERYTHRMLPNNLKINLFVHISAMMERLVRGNPITECQGLEHMKQQAPEFAGLFQRAFSPVGRKYGVEINEEETAVIYQIIKNANESGGEDII